MKLLLIPFKLAAIPVALGFWALKWVGIFLTSMAGWIFYALAGFMFNLGLILLAFGQSNWAETLQLWIFAFFIFVNPFVAATITTAFGAASSLLRMFIFSW